MNTTKKYRTKTKVAWDVMKAAADPARPLLAQIVITQRCNLSCGYCFEYDKVSKPVDLKILKGRIDELKRLHIAISNAKRNFVGTYHKIKAKYLQLYLNEFVYKPNRRYFGEKLFDRLLIARITVNGH